MIKRSATLLPFRHCILCNFLTTLLRPNFDKAVDTVEELVEREIMVFDMPGTEMWKQLFMTSPNKAYQKMGASYYICKDYDEYYEYQVKMTVEGGLCQLSAYMETWQWKYSRDHHPQGRGYWRSKETLSGRRYFRYFWVLFCTKRNTVIIQHCTSILEGLMFWTKDS